MKYAIKLLDDSFGDSCFFVSKYESNSTIIKSAKYKFDSFIEFAKHFNSEKEAKDFAYRNIWRKYEIVEVNND